MNFSFADCGGSTWLVLTARKLGMMPRMRLVCGVCSSARKGEVLLCWEVRELLEDEFCNPEFPSLIVLETMSGESGNADSGADSSAAFLWNDNPEELIDVRSARDCQHRDGESEA
jgi:hypothetical protein